MYDKHYTSERNVQIVIALLKAHNIKRVIASPGTTNMTFVASIQNDPFFEIYSSVDERSAAYMACGMAAETGEPVVLSCTGATASRNYMPGLTEAYYRKLPVLAITSHRGDAFIGHLLDQQIDRRSIPNDIAVCSVTVPLVKDAEDASYCRIEATKAILALNHRGGGPAHINMYTTYSQDFSVLKLPAIKKIERHTAFDNLPLLPEGKRIAIFVGSHKPFSQSLISAIDNFCKAHNSIVLCDHTSGYRGAFEVHANILFQQIRYQSHLLDVDILIHLGEVSSTSPKIKIREVWRVSEDGEIRDTFGKLSHLFEMPEEHFFMSYTPSEFKNCSTYHLLLKTECEKAIESLPELPFSNLWVAQKIHQLIPQDSILFLGINNSLRSFNYFELPKEVTCESNVGGYGIDGGISTLIGSSLVNPQKLHFGVFGDLAFFYDMNVLGNRHIGKNVRILLINNGKGNEFRNYGHLCSLLEEDGDKFVAAAGHFGNKSSLLVRNYAENLGYRYYVAASKEEFLHVCNDFFAKNTDDQSIIFEIFTTTENESSAIKLVRTHLMPPNAALREKVEGVIRGAIGTKGKNIIKKILLR